jgi:hypothetical protein
MIFSKDLSVNQNTVTQLELNLSESASIENFGDYDIPNEDINQAKMIEPFYDLFRLFTLRNDETITLALAAIRSLARQTDGYFTREQMNLSLNYLSTEYRSKVIKALQDYGWISTNGLRYEIPERVRNLMVFLFGTLTRSGHDMARDLNVSFSFIDLDEAAGVDKEIAEGNFESAIGSLRKLKAQLEQVLEKKSSTEANSLLSKSKEVKTVIDNIVKRLKEKNHQSYKYTMTTEVFKLRAEIIRMYQDLLTFINQDIQANAKSFGKYLTPEQINEFLEKAPTEILANLARRRISNEIKPLFVTRNEIMTKGCAYLERRSVKQEPTLPPPTVEIKRETVTVNVQEGAAIQFYRELLAKLEIRSPIPLEKAIVKNTYGDSLFRAGLLATVLRDLENLPGNKQISLHLFRSLETLEDGPVHLITKGLVSSDACPDPSIDLEEL